MTKYKRKSIPSIPKYFDMDFYFSVPFTFGVRMKVAFLLITLLIIFLLITSCNGQSVNHFQDVGNDFGTEWISKFNADNPQPSEQNLKNDLWAWGGAPKGNIIVNGTLAPDPYYIWRSLNYTQGWLGKAYVDPYTGYPVYAYIDPYTGRVLNFYVDPTTGSPVYTNVESTAEVPYYGAVPSFYSPNYNLGGYTLPPVFN